MSFAEVARSVGPVMDMWSSPTTVYAGGVRQLPVALGGRRMVLVVDARLRAQLSLVSTTVPPVDVVRVDPASGLEDVARSVMESLARHPEAVPVALGGGSIMDVVRLAALATVDPAANGFRAAADGLTFLPSRAVNPTVCIPSTLGTAAEVSAVAVRTSNAGTAMILSPGLRSAGAVLDPAITRTLPPAALAAGLVEPWSRVCVPAIAGEHLRLQDEIARGLGNALLGLGDEAAVAEPDEDWRFAAALASAQTHLSLLAVGRAPAGHVLWPLATEVVRATGLSKAHALAALLPAWLRCLAAGVLGPTWGSAHRVRAILGAEPGEAAEHLEAWLRRLSLPTRLPADLEIKAIVARVVSPWQTSGVFLPGAQPTEIAAVAATARSAGQ